MKFINKFSLERHQNKKLQCNKITNYQCKNCKKCFSQNKSLIFHVNNNICINKLDINKTII